MGIPATRPRPRETITSNEEEQEQYGDCEGCDVLGVRLDGRLVLDGGNPVGDGNKDSRCERFTVLSFHCTVGPIRSTLPPVRFQFELIRPNSILRQAYDLETKPT
jgi:hypothetical protein